MPRDGLKHSHIMYGITIVSDEMFEKLIIPAGIQTLQKMIAKKKGCDPNDVIVTDEMKSFVIDRISSEIMTQSMFEEELKKGNIYDPYQEFPSDP